MENNQCLKYFHYVPSCITGEQCQCSNCKNRRETEFREFQYEIQRYWDDKTLKDLSKLK